jgi:hypothetical protein
MSLSRTHSLSLTHSLSHTISLTHSLSLTHTLSLSHSLSHTISLTHSLSHTHSLSLTHTHSLSLSMLGRGVEGQEGVHVQLWVRVHGISLQVTHNHTDNRQHSFSRYHTQTQHSISRHAHEHHSYSPCATTSPAVLSAEPLTPAPSPLGA